MAEYIEREAVLGFIKEDVDECGDADVSYRPIAYGTILGFKSAISLVNALPAADVVEVRHGEWVGDNNMRLNLPTLLEYDDWHCSECGSYYPEGHISRLSNYCPDCGAKMDGKGEGE